jgi:hypothetical protein
MDPHTAVLPAYADDHGLALSIALSAALLMPSSTYRD